MIRLLIITLALSSFATAQTKHLPPEAKAKFGYEKAENDLYPKTESYDHKWIVEGFTIHDAQGKKVFSWQDNGGVVRKYMVVSWSPDSQRVILLDHFPRGAMLFAAQLVNGVWQSVPTDMNLNALELRYYAYPKTSLINRISILDWVSVTAFKIEDKFMVDDLPSPLFHWETATETLQFTNDALRAVN
jgi:hypothetical protein